ncbi:MAG: nitroreductase family protein [Pseudomonadota bacterium]
MKKPSSQFFSMRDAAAGVDPLFVERWSPRSFLADPIPTSHLSAIFDAARWSPSSYNEQPWRFVTAERGKNSFDAFLECLVPANQAWAKNAPVLGFVIGLQVSAFNKQKNPFTAFDAGAAWMAMTLQARQFGYYTHGMGGILPEKVAQMLKLDAEKEVVLCGFALGKIGPVTALPQDYQLNEKPSPRKPLSDVWQAIE